MVSHVAIKVLCGLAQQSRLTFDWLAAFYPKKNRGNRMFRLVRVLFCSPFLSSHYTFARMLVYVDACVAALLCLIP